MCAPAGNGGGFFTVTGSVGIVNISLVRGRFAIELKMWYTKFLKEGLCT